MNRKALIAVAVCICIGLLPIPINLAPEWNVVVLDESGKPLVGVPVRESWYHYLNDASGSEKKVSDTDGKVSFPRRDKRTLLGVLAFFRVITAIIPHGGGSSADVTVYRDGYGMATIYWKPRDDPFRTTITLRSCNNDPKQYGCTPADREMLNRSF